MRAHFKNLILVFGALTAMLFAVDRAAAQGATRLRSGVEVRGEVGGEGHQSYVIRARRGQIIRVRILRGLRSPDDNFNLTVSRKPSFFDAQEVNFGKESSGRGWMAWTGKAPRSGNY
jgi:hypothetical protein